MMDNAELMKIWSALKHYCSERKRSGTGRDCAVFRVCTHRDCVEHEADIRSRIGRAMIAGIPVEYNGMRYSHICGYGRRCDRRRDADAEPEEFVELMDLNGNSILRVPPEKVRFPDGEGLNETERCASCGAVIPEERQICPACEAKAGGRP